MNHQQFSLANAMVVDVDDLGTSFVEQGFGGENWSYVTDYETRCVMDGFDELKIKGTFFIPGSTASRSPDLVHEIHRRGHDVASHGYYHCRVEKMNANQFYQDITRSKKLLEDLIGEEVDSYKAPIWSLTAKTPWAYDELIRAGFKIDHSPMPQMKKFLGYSSTHHEPFYYKKEILVIPPTSLNLGGFAVPFCGGAYNAHIPTWFQIKKLSKFNQDGLPFNYFFHPYEYTPHPINQRRIKANQWRMSLYANHNGAYQKHLPILAKKFNFTTLKKAYESYILGDKSKKFPKPAFNNHLFG